MRAMRGHRAAAIVAAGVVGLSVVATGTANAAIYRCKISSSNTNCARVTGIDPGSWLQPRTGPGYGYPNHPSMGGMPNGREVGVACWTTGDGAVDAPNYRYWIRIDNGNNTAYVNDWYLDTGGPAAWKQILDPC